jgi:hypothetical protein
MDPRIRIHTKMSWIRNTGAKTYQEEGAAGWPAPPAPPPLAAETLFEPQSLLLAALYHRTKINDNRRKLTKYGTVPPSMILLISVAYPDPGSAT